MACLRLRSLMLRSSGATQPVEFVRSQVTRRVVERINRLEGWQSLVALCKAAKEKDCCVCGRGSFEVTRTGRWSLATLGSRELEVDVIHSSIGNDRQGQSHLKLQPHQGANGTSSVAGSWVPVVPVLDSDSDTLGTLRLPLTKHKEG